MWDILKQLPLMEILSLLDTTISTMSGVRPSSLVQPGRTLQASNDIFLTRFDRQRGYMETMYAKKGDDIDIICEDPATPGRAFRVRNVDNNEQIDTVMADDLYDMHGLY